MEEKVLRKESPSQIVNLGVFILCTITCFLIVPIFIAVWRWIVVKCIKYEITDQRIILTKGVFSRTTDELEHYRVKDIRLEEPFLLRIFGLSNVHLATTDRSHQNFNIVAIKDGKALREELRKHVEETREKKKVREFSV
jgi:uncharacterized membrane protein YdbT with pleckstrin-like domain